MNNGFLTFLTSIALTIQQDHGKWGEALALEFLVRGGYTIVAKNWRYKRAEIDIIAMEKDILVFVEVKTKAYDDFGPPELMVGKRKQRLIIDAAMAYMRSVGYEWEIRFDIMTILGTPDSEPEVRHFVDAFFPGIGFK